MINSPTSQSISYVICKTDNLLMISFTAVVWKINMFLQLDLVPFVMALVLVRNIHLFNCLWL